MNLKTLLRNIGEMAKAQKLVNFSVAGASLAEINPMEIAWYPLFYAIPAGTHTITENTTTFNLTLYYIDRLLEDNSNEVDIFSSSIENLKNIINGIKGLQGVVEVESTYTMNNFMPERLNDRLCGSYAQVRIMVANDTVCFVEEEEPPVDYSKEYLTIQPLEDGNIFVRANLEVSTDGGKTWKTVNNEELELSKSKDYKFRGRGVAFRYFAPGSIATKFNIYGNVASLQYGDEFDGQKSMLGNISLAFNNTDVVDASNLYLPDPTFAKQYRSMFAGCTSLTTAPELPATTLASACYQGMFNNCASLTAAPKLPATTLADDCYQGMFSNCTSLTTAPELPATNLAAYCYRSMFHDCTSLTTAPTVLPATTLTDYCYSNMFKGCTNLTTAPELPATTMASGSYNNMFSNCTSLTTAPELPATTLATYCYTGMFSNCASLTAAPELPATTLAASCYWNMFSNCTSLNYIKCLAIDISAGNCTTYWVNSVASTGTFVKNASADWSVKTGNNGIPYNWSVENVENE